MAYADVTYIGDGAATQFALTFSYQSISEVYVTVNDAQKLLYTDYTIESGVVRFYTAPPASARVRFYRRTVVSSAKVEWTAGSVLGARALTTNTRQLLYAIQEINDRLDAAGLTGGSDTDEGVTTETLTPDVLLTRMLTFLSNHTTILYP